MFSNSSQPSKFVDEGTVVQVDDKAMVCKVKTISGQMLQAVPWVIPFGGSDRSGLRFTPGVGNRVLLSFGLGYPIIQGFLPRIQGVDGATPLTLHDGAGAPDFGTFGLSESMKGDQNKPTDIHAGDQVLSSSGGSIIAALKAGTVLIRGSRTAEILLSKLTGLVRIFSRNFEHFTDLSTDVVKNFKGRVYRYVGYGRTFAQAKQEDYRLNFYYGDAAAAEAVKSNYNLYSGTPATDTIFYKEQVRDATQEIMRRTLDLTGNQEVWIKVGDQFTRVVSTGQQLTFSWKDLNTVTINETEITAHHNAGAIVTLTADHIQATLGAGQATISDSSTQLKNGSHAVTITSGGVAIT